MGERKNMRRVNTLPALLSAALAISACTAQPEAAAPQQVEGTSSKLTGAVLNGATATGTPVPVTNSLTGSKKIIWPSTYSRLLAADAVAECTLIHRVGVTEGASTDGDKFFAALATSMSSTISNSQCSWPNPAPALHTATETFMNRWVEGRKVAACNLDLATQAPKAMEFNYVARVGTSSPYGLPDTATYQAASPAPTFTNSPTSDTSLVNSARNKAQDQVHYAWLNLCVAQKLREHLESFQAAVTSEEDLLELQSIVRQRSLAAAYQYATIVKTIDTQAPTTAIAHPWQFPTLIRYWPSKDTSWSSKATEIGKDIAMAVQLLSEAADQHTTSLMRSASASSANFGKYNSARLAIEGPLDSSLEGARAEILAYGYGPQTWSLPRAAAVDMKAPEVEILLGLIRKSGGLALTASNKIFLINTNATQLLQRVETWVRQRDCDAVQNTSPTCATIPGGTTPDQYRVRQRFNIQPAHAQTIVRGFVEHLYGQPNQYGFDPDDIWLFRFDTQNVQLGLPMDLLDRFPGTHTYTGDFSSPTVATLTLDMTSPIGAPPPHVLQEQTWSYVPQRTNSFTVHPYQQGFNFRNVAWQTILHGKLTDALAVGSQAGLGYLRATLSRASATAAPIVNGAGDALWRVLVQSAGARQVVLRRNWTFGSSTSCAPFTFTNGSGTVVTPATCDVPADNGSVVDIVVNTRTGDPYTVLAVRPMTSPIAFGAKTTVAATTETIDPSIATVASGEVIRRYTVNIAAGAFVELRLENAGATSSILLHRGRMDAAVPTTGAANVSYVPPLAFSSGTGPMFARTASYGGSLNAKIARTFATMSSNWSKPQYDGLDLASDWAPVGDASLHGGQQGEEAYKYFLRAAATSADQATSAVEKALEGLNLEAQDSVAATINAEKGKNLSIVEEQSICGWASKGSRTPGPHSCAQTLSLTIPTVPTCPAAPNDHCVAVYDGINSLLGTSFRTQGIPITSTVATQLANASPDFSAYRGGELEGLLLGQWSAWKALDGAIRTAVSAGAAAQAEVNAARQETAAATTEFETTIVAQQTQLRALFASTTEAYQQLSALLVQWNDYAVALDAADREASSTTGMCSDAYYKRMHASGFSFGGLSRGAVIVMGIDQTGLPTTLTVEPSGETYSYGPLMSATQNCLDARNRAVDVRKTQVAREELINLGILHAAAIIEQNNFTQHALLPAQSRAAFERFTVAPLREAAVAAQAGTAGATQLQLVQQALNDLLAWNAKISEAFNQARLAKARVDLDTWTADVNIQSRFNLRRAFRSYDLWRARALSENARRLAVTARRAIEARFVEDLSELSAPEVFVEAPNLWANEVYRSDLNPPSALGRTRAPVGQSGVYASKLQDYVNNLQLFVDGYAVSRPSAGVRSDTEVIQLPAPSGVSTAIAGDGTSYAYRDIEAGAWTFYCPNTNTWVKHPNSAAFNVTTWTLNAVCGGSAPTRAKLSFMLDPWGRSQKTIATPPYTDRYNARWGEFSINLVGSGVRDCTRATDPTACYSEPFIRFGLNHVGPVMASSHSGRWTTLPIAPGTVDGGKALASEEWLDPVANAFANPIVASVARQEFVGRPLGGAYELILELTPDVRVERIERIQLLLQTSYWVRQN